MLRRRFISALGILPLSLFTLPAAAEDAMGRLGVRLRNMVAGDEQPAILLEPVASVSELEIALSREDGEKKTLRSGAIGANTERRLEVKQELGSSHDYEAAFSVTWGDGSTSEFSMRFKLTRADELELTFDTKDVDLDQRTMTFEVSGPATKVELVILGENKKILKTVTKDLSSHKSGSEVKLSYPDPGATIMVMDLKVYDVTGGYKGVRLTPVSTSIPHDDVEFDSGKSNIRPSEEPKLRATMRKLNEAVAKFRDAGVKLELKLFVAGYTDTVGSRQSNQALSNQRARSISQWFIRHGLKLDVYYQGFGEDVLAKRTPDETDEPRNRRAVYVLATQTPGKSGLFPRTNWARAR